MADESYNVPNLADGEVFRVEQTIKRSRFITSVGRTDSVESAKAFIEKIKTELTAGPIALAQPVPPIVSAQATTENRTEPQGVRC